MPHKVTGRIQAEPQRTIRGQLHLSSSDNVASHLTQEQQASCLLPEDESRPPQQIPGDQFTHGQSSACQATTSLNSSAPLEWNIQYHKQEY